MLIARLEPENNIETILDGVVLSENKSDFLVIGKHSANAFGLYLKEKFEAYNNIKFIGGVYDLEKLNNLRYFSNLYFHGHSVGGTNPSLLEAMSSKALIIANDNEFNKSILKDNAYYFKNSVDVKKHINCLSKEDHNNKIENSYNQIRDNFSWSIINKKYLDFIYECNLKNSNKNK